MRKSPHFAMLDRIKANAESNADATEPRKKLKIPAKVRGDVWNTYIGAQMAQHRCICCKKVTIKQTEFEVGHVISEKNGGTLEINNLRPICSVCNKSMGCTNMVEFVKTYGYFI